MARLALIADDLKAENAKRVALEAIEKALMPWFTGTSEDVLVYDSTYGGIVPSIGLNQKYSDYGAAWYNDHHFHYGYFISAFAAVSKLDPRFAESNRAAIDSIVRDIATMNPDDRDFPLARHKDFFDGHSWASGLYIQANGKGQESSSEAVNAYYSVCLYAKANANSELLNFARLLLATEIQAAKTYWHMKKDNKIYDAVFAAGKMAGNIGALDVTTTTWFGSELEFVHGINMYVYMLLNFRCVNMTPVCLSLQLPKCSLIARLLRRNGPC